MVLIPCPCVPPSSAFWQFGDQCQDHKSCLSAYTTKPRDTREKKELMKEVDDRRTELTRM